MLKMAYQYDSSQIADAPPVVKSSVLESSDSEDKNFDFHSSLPILNSGDPDLFYFDPFPLQSPDFETITVPRGDVPTNHLGQTLTSQGEPCQQLDELAILHCQLQQRMDSLEAACKSLENEYVAPLSKRELCIDDPRFHCLQRSVW
jgi:hypothetical protein